MTVQLLVWNQGGPRPRGPRPRRDAGRRRSTRRRNSASRPGAFNNLGTCRAGNPRPQTGPCPRRVQRSSAPPFHDLRLPAQTSSWITTLRTAARPGQGISFLGPTAGSSFSLAETCARAGGHWADWVIHVDASHQPRNVGAVPTKPSAAKPRGQLSRRTCSGQRQPRGRRAPSTCTSSGPAAVRRPVFLFVGLQQPLFARLQRGGSLGAPRPTC